MFYEVVEGKDFIKSSAGGMSAIASVTTDQNNMGGLFVRKVRFFSTFNLNHVSCALLK